MNRWGLLTVVVAFVLVACGGQSELRAGGYTIFVHDASLLPRGGDGALVEGRLIVRGGCVLVDQAEVGIAYPVIWPSGTSIVGEDPLTLELPSGEQLAVGQKVSGGGGYHNVASNQVEAAIPMECVAETGEVAVFNPDDDPTVRE